MIYKTTDEQIKAVISRPMSDLRATYYEVFDDMPCYGFDAWLDYIERLDLEFAAYSQNGRVFVSLRNGLLYGYCGNFDLGWTLLTKYRDKYYL